ncbi:small ubiquitin-related modifier sumo [Diplodia corticola]|uniref:Small ubiquitin-related modifier sumo n=1 Tax=Diplodia corticola TaxID=236234 RepID=A0A1J9RT79_9PEZI|nr:small ubiquitin-related modifier sumo [Diplodia corticola]OJD31076.1 small ubiquitin-related modifier sumo [Diplodia corticola]
MADSAPAAGPAPPRQKRSFFKKPSWKQKADPADDDDPTAMFDGSKQTFSAIMEERERVRAKKLQEQEESARKRELEEAARHGKRRRTAHHEHRPDEDAGESMSAEQTLSPCSSPRPPKVDAHSLSARYEAVARAREAKPSPTVVVDLGDTDSDDDAPLPAGTASTLATHTALTGSDEEMDESDPEIREIIREARREKILARHRNTAHGSSPIEPGNRCRPSPGAATNCGTSQLTPVPDPPVQILVTSRIPDTKPLIVTRKLSQRLQEVRQAWCKRQGFDQEMTDSIFFTFKGRRLFDVATCRSLGLYADAFGRVRMKDSLDWDENDSKVTVEAVTLYIFNEDAKEAQRQREPEPESEVAAEPEPKRTKIIIRTKDFGDAKFTCGPETSFEKLATSSINRLKVPASKRPYLLFDGERLDPHDTMAELEDFEDGDVLEMHFD